LQQCCGAAQLSPFPLTWHPLGGDDDVVHGESGRMLEQHVHDIIIDAERVPSERERDQLRRTATLLQAEVHFVDVARPGTPLHDPGKLAAALDGVRVGDHGPAAPAVKATEEIPIDGERSQSGVHGPGRQRTKG